MVFLWYLQDTGILNINFLKPYYFKFVSISLIGNFVF